MSYIIPLKSWALLFFFFLLNLCNAYTYQVEFQISLPFEVSKYKLYYISSSDIHL